LLFRFSKGEPGAFSYRKIKGFEGEGRPDFLSPEEGLLSHEVDGDLGDRGKFYWLDGEEGLDYSHYLTFDPRFRYSRNYVHAMVHESNVRDGKAILGIQGLTIDPDSSGSLTLKDEYPFDKELRKAQVTHVLGTGTMLISGGAIVTPDDFGMRNANPDVQLASAAQEQGVPMVAIARPKNWVTGAESGAIRTFFVQRHMERSWRAMSLASLTALGETAISSWELYEDPLGAKAEEITDIIDKQPLEKVYAEATPVGGFDGQVEALNAK
jgi:hypothetical protein